MNINKLVLNGSIIGFVKYIDNDALVSLSTMNAQREEVMTYKYYNEHQADLLCHKLRNWEELPLANDKDKCLASIALDNVLLPLNSYSISFVGRLAGSLGTVEPITITQKIARPIHVLDVIATQGYESLQSIKFNVVK